MKRTLTVAILACFALMLCMLPARTYAEEAYDEGSYDYGAPDESGDEPEEEEPPPPPRTITVYYDANGGEGAMDPTVFTEGEQNKLSKCTFTRNGYSVEGWNTSPDGQGAHYVDSADMSGLFADESLEALTLYAQWGSQVYFIHYATGVSPENSSPVEGTMPTQLAVNDAEVALLPCAYTRAGYTMRGWLDAEGTFHELDEVGTNFAQGTSTTSWKLADIDIARVRSDPSPDWTCQGSVVFVNDEGATCVCMGFVLFTDAYSGGSLEDYDSEIMLVNIDTGEVLAHASGLMLEHVNDIAYRPDNGHFYVAQGGLNPGYPNGIVELDENLAEVRTVTPEGTHHIWNISYYDGEFYAIGNASDEVFARGNAGGDTCDLIHLDPDLNVLDVRTINYSAQGFTGQGMVYDGEYLYSIVHNTHDQRLNIFTLDGEARGNQYLDMPGEIETASYWDGRLYFSTNQRTAGSVFGANLVGTTMTAVWEPNAYEVAFDANGCTTTSFPELVRAQYDESMRLPAEKPESPGHVFVSWNTEPDGTGTSFAPGQAVENLAESGTVTLYAQWTRPRMALVGDNGTTVRGRRFRRAAREQSTAVGGAESAPRHIAQAAALPAMLAIPVPRRRRRAANGDSPFWLTPFAKMGQSPLAAPC